MPILVQTSSEIFCFRGLCIVSDTRIDSPSAVQRQASTLPLESQITAQLLQNPQWRLPAHHLACAQWLNEQLDEGASWVIHDIEDFSRDFAAEQATARVERPAGSEGLAGYPELNLGALRPPYLEGQQLVFYVQRYDSRLPLKVTVSLMPPHLPALYEPVPQLLLADAVFTGQAPQVRL